ncbi:MAG TPA: fumarylacetoacetate hydrolase family protein [Desulfobacterales bacterium]|nr:fumarylacetoacetate hydrolase family protein [Desulfobacterales bacterium]
MRLVRFGAHGREEPGLWREGRTIALRRLFPEIPDIGEAFFRDGWPERLRTVDAPGDATAVRLGPPVARPSKIVCLGINYAAHGSEGGFKPPERPVIFAKTPNALNGPFDPIVLPRSSGQVDWEVELAVVIGREGKRIPRERALDYVAGYTVMNDVSGREAQFNDPAKQWLRGKSFDTFAPLGPALVTADELGDPGDLALETLVNGVVMQSDRTRNMIFDVPAILAFVSEDITLAPGDIIATGTPSGVGHFRTPPVELRPGDTVECRIEKIGAIRNAVVGRE